MLYRAIQAILQFPGGRHLAAPCLSVALPLFCRPLFVHLNRGLHSSFIQASIHIHLGFCIGLRFLLAFALLVSVLLLHLRYSEPVRAADRGRHHLCSSSCQASTTTGRRLLVAAAAEVEVAA